MPTIGAMPLKRLKTMTISCAMNTLTMNEMILTVDVKEVMSDIVLHCSCCWCFPDRVSYDAVAGLFGLWGGVVNER